MAGTITRELVGAVALDSPPGEVAAMLDAADAPPHLLAQRAVEAARGGVGAGAVEETGETSLTPPQGHGEG